MKEGTMMKMSKRETEIVKLLAKGLSNREISGKLSISVRTVESYMQRIFVKLNAKNRCNAIALYMQARYGPPAGRLQR